MQRDKERQSEIILSIIGIIPVVWLGLLIAPSVKGGLPEIFPSLMNVFNNPFHIVLCEDSVKTVLILLLCYGMGIGIYFSTQKNYRRREEHGSAKWGNAKTVDKKYRQSPFSDNKLMTQNVCIGLNAKKHRRNLNTLVCGGSGAGKTRFYCKPNLMQCNTSFVILDPKGEILRDTGKLLERKGFEVRVLDLISMEKSHCYNPYEVLYWCGLRIGELLALSLSDIDFEGGIISVTKTYNQLSGREIISTPKTPSSVRKVSMPAFLVDELKEYIGLLYEPKEDQRIFQISKSKINSNFHKLSDQAGLKRITIHGLRHSHVSLLISKKYDIFEVSKRIGHKSVKTTQDIYGHLFDDVQKSIANDLNMIRRGGV